jgi:hypothetical protein
MGRYSDLRQVKLLLNIPDSVTASDDKLNRHIAEADNYVDTQLGLFVATPVANPDPNIISLGSSLAAAFATYWNSQSKSPDLLASITYYERRLANHIQAIYGKRNIDGLGASRWGKSTGGILGTEPGGPITGGLANQSIY